jgi:hypothetical protein
MGYTNAYDAAQYAELEQALEWHLTSNHYPPVSVEFVPACKQAIQTFVVAASSTELLTEDHVFDQLCKTYVELPNGKNMSVVDIVEQLHLDAFVDQILNEQ